MVECAETLVRHGLTNYREVMEHYREDEKLKRLKNDFPRKRQLEWVRAREQPWPLEDFGLSLWPLQHLLDLDFDV